MRFIPILTHEDRLRLDCPFPTEPEWSKVYDLDDLNHFRDPRTQRVLEDLINDMHRDYVARICAQPEHSSAYAFRLATLDELRARVGVEVQRRKHDA